MLQETAGSYCTAAAVEFYAEMDCLKNWEIWDWVIRLRRVGKRLKLPYPNSDIHRLPLQGCA